MHKDKVNAIDAWLQEQLQGSTAGSRCLLLTGKPRRLLRAAASKAAADACGLQARPAAARAQSYAHWHECVVQLLWTGSRPCPRCGTSTCTSCAPCPCSLLPGCVQLQLKMC